MTPKQRAEPLSRADRRKSILDAVIPLVVENGTRVTTAQMAKAACIAEGTIFRVFPDKLTLLHEAVKSSFDPQPELQALAAVDPEAKLEERVRKAAKALEDRFERVHTLVSVARSLKGGRSGRRRDTFRVAREANSEIEAALAELFAAAEGELGVPPMKAATLLNSLMFATHYPFNAVKDRLSTEEVVSILLNGILRVKGS